MNSDDHSAEKPVGTAKGNSDSGKPCCCEELKHTVAVRLQRAAETLGKTAADHEKTSYIRQFDYEQVKEEKTHKESLC